MALRCGPAPPKGTTTRSGSCSTGHSGAVYSYLFRLTADWSEAEDLTSAVFLQAWRRRAEVVIDRDSSLPWLLGTSSRPGRAPERSR